MDLQAFIDLVRNTPTLADNIRQKYIDAASGYTPEIREKMAVCIREQEETLTKAVDEYRQQKACNEQNETANRLAALHAEEAAQHAAEERTIAAMEQEIANIS